MPVPKLDRPTLYDGSKGILLAPEMPNVGKDPSDLGEWLNLLAPDIVRKAHRAYIDAGSEVIQTNTFNGNRLRLARHGLADRVREVNVAAAQIAREAAGENVAVAGDIGPSGKVLMMGESTVDELREVFAEQAKALDEGGVDFLHIETVSDMDEAVAAVEGARSVSKLPVMLTMSFDAGNPERGLRTMMGVTAAQVVEKGDELGLYAVGANCGKGLLGYQTLLQQFIDAGSSLPIVAKVNAGLPQFDGEKMVFDGTPEKMAEYAVWCAERGIQLIGVCCGGTPAHIAAMADALARFRR